MDHKMIAGLQAMSRDDLLNFAATALATIERLEKSNQQFKEDLEASGTVDVGVIWKWRSWLDTMDRERNDWAVMATTLSAENKQLKADNQRLLYRAEQILKLLDDISVFTNIQVDITKPPSFLIGAIHRIKKSIDQGKSALLEFFADEPVEVSQPTKPVEPAANG